jgi:hypothetical protein
LTQAHGEDVIARSDDTYPICDIENTHRATSTSPIARSAKTVPAPGAGVALVCFVLAKTFAPVHGSCRPIRRSPDAVAARLRPDCGPSRATVCLA